MLEFFDNLPTVLNVHIVCMMEVNLEQMEAKWKHIHEPVHLFSNHIATAFVLC